MDDPESVELISQEMHNRAGESQRPTMLGWTAELNLLATIVDVLSEMHATLIQINSEGNKRPTVVHIERPVTAIERVESKLAIVEHRRRVKAWTRRGDDA